VKMAKTKIVVVRYSQRQFEIFTNKMEYLGYRNMSQYIRDCTLKEDLATFKLLKEIHAKVTDSADDKILINTVQTTKA